MGAAGTGALGGYVRGGWGTALQCFGSSVSRYISPLSLSNFPKFDLVPILGFGLEMGVVPGFIYRDWISSGFWVLIPFDLVFFLQNQVCVVC